MRYADWNKLTAEEKKNTHWKHHPHVRTATIFTILGAFIFAVFMLRVFQNKRVHVNRKPNGKEAYAVAKQFISDRLKQPSTAVYPKHDFTSNIDTASSRYVIWSTVSTQDSSGKMVKSNWEAHLSYTGGDWANRNSWKVLMVKIGQ